MSTAASSADAFRRLHDGPDAFVITNPWDIGSARILASLGYKALATSSAGMAFAHGLGDGKVAPDQVLAHCRQIVGATDLPVSADLENGFADSPEGVAETIHSFAGTGLAGGSIEDSTGKADAPIYDFEQAVERIAAAAEMAGTVAGGFVLTARAENFLHGRADLDDTIRRLQAYEKAGAEVLFAPGLPDLDSIRTVCAEVTKPVSVMIGIPGRTFSVDELAAAGVRRISTGPALARAAYTALIAAAEEIKDSGTFDFAIRALGSGKIVERFG
ncbi:isocitrate lyase/phosphoenolpyruvate mutase family protein [Thalassobaculum sp. OXR-137]|uniref:isocitrate lyase/PEP mutase family protein n=1 Tax=Thalassobaculum sp. OXR-137 TaxID=3100173 RepID=UPI002AC9937D|nr:isocitrate lyase/phosphoenolpyruvate mutase family protein [Thalassobaculum sp. OXR-137]WPZ35397.1 isocitrate lyase/phosphoenolpyruvate mutase family protein [Thalassobaculum sp. OXR-137]